MPYHAVKMIWDALFRCEGTFNALSRCVAKLGCTVTLRGHLGCHVTYIKLYWDALSRCYGSLECLVILRPDYDAHSCCEDCDALPRCEA